MKDKIKKILVENIDIPVNEMNALSQNDPLTELGLDSLNIIYVIAEIEQEFGFTFAEDDMFMDNFSTLARMEATISGYLRGA